MCVARMWRDTDHGHRFEVHVAVRYYVCAMKCGRCDKVIITISSKLRDFNASFQSELVLNRMKKVAEKLKFPAKIIKNNRYLSQSLFTIMRIIENYNFI